MNPASEGRYVPGLDGLRALAVVAAMAFHAGVLEGGFLGVDLFFVVSGFLITDLLLEDAASSGRVRLARFWAGRARRLAPALLLVLAVVLVWAYVAATPSMAQTTTEQAGWSLLYLTNWFALFGDVGYWGAEAAKTPLNHLWSLAIEEQFYVVWPLVVAAAATRRRPRRVLAAVAITGMLASGVWQWWAADHGGTERAYLGTDTRAVALLAGCALAVLVASRGERPPPVGRHRPTSIPPAALDASVLAALAWLGWSWAAADLDDRSMYHGWLASCSVAAAVLVVAVVNRRTAWYSRALAAPPLVWVGRRSYSLYLWHWPIWVMVSATGWSGAGLWGARLGLTALAASASYAWVEQPIRRGWGRGRRLVPVAGVTVAAMAVAVVAFPPSVPPAQQSDPVTLGAPGNAGSLDIMVVGDSWARNLGFALDLADPASRNTYTNLGIGGCGLLVGTEPGCIERQRVRWADVIASRRPDAVLLVTGSVDQGIGARLGGRLVLPCDPAWDGEYARRLDDAITILRGGLAQIPVYVTTVREAVRRPEGSACVNRLLAEAAARNGVKVLDLHGQLCPDGRCLTSIDRQPVYDDTSHLAPAGQRWIGGWILDVVEREVTPAAPAAGPGAVTGPCSGAGEPVALPVAAYSSRPDPSYPDAGGELVDGRRGRSDIADPAWHGAKAESGDIVVTLEGTRSVCAVVTSWLQVLGANVQPPALVEVYVSTTQGQLGGRLGTAGPPRLSAADQTATIRISAGSPLTGGFVTIRARALAEWSFVDELTVLGPPP